MPHRLSLLIILPAILLFSLNVHGQGTGKLLGKITDTHGNPLEFANIAIVGSAAGASSDAKGNFELTIPANKDVSVLITSIGYYNETINLRLAPGEKRTIARSLRESTTVLSDVVVEDQQLRTTNLSRINPKNAEIIPSVSGGIEALIKTLPGVSSNNELSSQYSVRGGNYDENLVYVNDIEIYRPFLVRSGQQEGLSFLNSDLVSSILFSAGGFDARYGDKMSSVLDIKYKRPTTFAGSFSASLLGASAHVEGASDNHRFTYLMGVRQKSNQYILGGLDTKGEYRPSFTDVQGLLTYDLNEQVELSFLGNYARNAYNLVPTSRETKFGTQDMPLRLTIYFDGKEVDDFNNYMGAFSLTYKPHQNTQLRWTVSAFQSHESETYDIQGQYWIANLQNNSGDSIEVTETSGIGTFLNHARNYLDATVLNAEHRGAISSSSNYLQWAVKYQHEIIDDKMNEWVMIDSTGYSIPYTGGNPGQPGNNRTLTLAESVFSKNSLSSNRYSGFVQNMFVLDGDSTRVSITAGVRANYWDVNKQLLISPRATFSYKPNWKN
ncbi:MAG TPA: TonB-dependent receptor, partial [Bacteroidales bacterium]